MTNPVSIKLAKRELRSLVKTKVTKVSEESIQAQSTSITSRLMCLKSYQAAQRIGIYLSMPFGEVQTDALVRQALASGKRVFVPYLQKPTDSIPGKLRSLMEMVDLRSLKEYENLERDSWGIPSMDKSTVEVREHILRDKQPLDIILLPGLAFDVETDTGLVRRLGHGRGFYDMFLHRYEEAVQPKQHQVPTLKTKVLLYGLALKEQYFEEDNELSVPVDQHDFCLHGLVVGDGRMIQSPSKHDQALD